MTLVDYDKCKKCGSELKSIDCPDGDRGCMVAHYGCHECRKVPCDACGFKRDPKALNGLCDYCVKISALWAAKQALKVYPRLKDENGKCLHVHSEVSSDEDGPWFCFDCHEVH